MLQEKDQGMPDRLVAVQVRFTESGFVLFAPGIDQILFLQEYRKFFRQETLFGRIHGQPCGQSPEHRSRMSGILSQSRIIP